MSLDDEAVTYYTMGAKGSFLVRVRSGFEPMYPKRPFLLRLDYIVAEYPVDAPKELHTVCFVLSRENVTDILDVLSSVFD